MKIYTFTYLVIISIFIGCQDNLKQKELELKEKELESIKKQNEIKNDSAAIVDITKVPTVERINYYSQTKYGFVVYRCEIPELKELFDDNYMVSKTTETFGSKVVEIPNYSKDEEYKLLDKGEIELKENFSIISAQIRGEINMKVRPYEKGYELMKIAEDYFSIENREINVYDSYSEASIARKNMGF